MNVSIGKLVPRIGKSEKNENKFGSLGPLSYICHEQEQTTTMAQKRHIITQAQTLKMNRKVSREMALEGSNGWAATHKVHTSKKSYSRKNKRNEKW